MNTKKVSTTIIFVALFAAITAAGCFVSVPLPGGVPIVLQDMLAILTGLLLGPVYGTAAVFVFLVLGCIGLPVFSGKAGIAVIIAGPTGGFLIGYLLAALTAGLFLHFLLPSSKLRETPAAKQWILITVAAILANVVNYCSGTIGFMRVTGKPLAPTLAAVLVPFIPGTIIKIVVSIPLTKKLRAVLANYINV